MPLPAGTVRFSKPAIRLPSESAGTSSRAPSGSAGPGLPARARGTDRRRVRRHAGFTIIELLVVIAVLGVLISLITALAGKAINQQRVRNTKQIMANVTLAIEQFATENPLRAIYDRKGSESFGPYPPYQLARDPFPPNSVSITLDTNPPTGVYRLENRLYRDMGQYQGSPADWVDIKRDDQTNDDIRALHAYLRVYSPSSLKTVQEAYLKPLATDPEIVNPTGTGTAVGTDGAVDVLGIHDAWGVPLDYMLYVKCEWSVIRNPQAGLDISGFRIVDRKPILRSRGINRDVYDAFLQAPPEELWRYRSNWIFSEELPKPWAMLTDGPEYRTGILDTGQGPPSLANGWVRAVAADENYAYRPDGDEEPPPP